MLKMNKIFLHSLYVCMYLYNYVYFKIYSNNNNNNTNYQKPYTYVVHIFMYIEQS